MDGPLPEIIEVGGSLPQNMVNDFFNCQCNKLCVFRQTMCGQTLYLRNKSVLLPWPSYLQDVQKCSLFNCFFQMSYQKYEQSQWVNPCFFVKKMKYLKVLTPRNPTLLITDF